MKQVDTCDFLKYHTNQQEEEKTGRVIVLHDIAFPVFIIGFDFDDQTEQFKDYFLTNLVPALSNNTVVMQTALKSVCLFLR